MATMEQRMIVRLHTAIGAERERLLREPLWDGDLEAADAAARVALRTALDVVDPQADRVQEVAASLRSLAALVESQAIHGRQADVTPEYLRRLAGQLRGEPQARHSDDSPAREVGERVEIGTDGCGCPITEELRPNDTAIDGTERVEHRPGCWATPRPCYVPSGFQAPEVIAEEAARCAAGHPGRKCAPRPYEAR
jgi:hypothetical protein